MAWPEGCSALHVNRLLKRAEGEILDALAKLGRLRAGRGTQTDDETRERIEAYGP